MGRSLLLLLGLMEALRYQMFPPPTPKTFFLSSPSDRKTYRVETDFPSETYPITEWSVNLWQFANQTLGTIWIVQPTISVFVVNTYNNWGFTMRNVQLTTPQTLETKWVFIQIGSMGTKTYQALTDRKGYQYYFLISNTITLAGNSMIALFNWSTDSDVITI